LILKLLKNDDERSQLFDSVFHNTSEEGLDSTGILHLSPPCVAFSPLKKDLSAVSSLAPSLNPGRELLSEDLCHISLLDGDLTPGPGPLHLSVRVGLTEMTAALREAGYTPSGPCGSITPFEVAFEHDSRSFPALFDAGSMNDLDCGAFWWAVHEGHEGVVKCLLNEPRIDVNCRKHRNGASPLQIAVSQCHSDVLGNYWCALATS
jgi:hypothetical protein